MACPSPRNYARATAIIVDPCTGARIMSCRSGADFPRGVDRGQSVGARVPPWWSRHKGAFGRSQRIGSVQERYALQAVARSSNSVSLRSTSCELRRTFQDRPRTVQGGGPFLLALILARRLLGGRLCLFLWLFLVENRQKLRLLGVR